jgi:hypothetical protein
VGRFCSFVALSAEQLKKFVFFHRDPGCRAEGAPYVVRRLIHFMETNHNAAESEITLANAGFGRIGGSYSARSHAGGCPRLGWPDLAEAGATAHEIAAVIGHMTRMTVCRQTISDSWLGNLRECLAHLV